MNYFLTILTEDSPHIPEEERIEIEPLGPGFTRILVRYGFMETPDIPVDLFHAEERGLKIDPMMVTYFLSRNIVINARYSRVARLQLALFLFLYHNALRPALFFNLPYNRVIEIGRQIRIQ